MKSKIKTILDWALYYRSLGLSVFPVHNSDKKPLVDWKKYQTELASESQIRSWWGNQFKNANIGIVTGKISGIVVIDVEKGGITTGLTPTVIANTGGGGWHFYYNHPGWPVANSAKKIRELTDVRGDGGFVVAPPSLHKSGVMYSWQVPPEMSGFADLPDWIFDRDTQPKDWSAIASGVQEGSRNDSAASMIGKLLHDLSPDLWENMAWPAVVVWNTKNHPPLSDEELRNVWDSIVRKELSSRNANEWKQLFSVKPKEGSLEIAKFLIDRHHIKTIGGKKDREIYIYDAGVYKSGINIIRHEIQLILEELGTIHAKNEIIEKVKDLTVMEREKFIVNRNYLNLRNGILNIETRQLVSHSSNFYFLHQLPIEYRPDADCPAIKKFLTEVLPRNLDLIQEWFGYCLYRDYFIKKAVIAVGERDTGKTTLLNLLAALIGHNNTSGVSLQKLALDKFAASNLYNKHVNFVDDLSSKDITDNGGFKMATGNGNITGEYKHGDQFQFKNYAKLIFACNTIPTTKDIQDEAYFSRWIIVQFDRSISKPDKFLGDKLTTPEELSGLLNFALIGLRRLLAKQEFSYTKDPDEIKEEMLKSGSVVANFAYDCLEQENQAWISKVDLYEAYVKYANDNNLPVGVINDFGRKITKYAPYISDSKHGGDTGWRNVRVRDNMDI